MKKSHEEKAYSHILSLHPSSFVSALILQTSDLFLGTNTYLQNAQIPSNTDLNFLLFISII